MMVISNILTNKTKEEHHEFDEPFTLSCNIRHELANHIGSILEALKKSTKKHDRLRIKRPKYKGDGEENTGHHEPKELPMVIRPLTDNEMLTLRTVCSCQCEDWSTIFIMYFDTYAERTSNEDFSRELRYQVSRCTFKGYVVLGVVNLASQKIKSSASKLGQMVHGIHCNALVVDSIFEPYAAVYNNTLISNSFIGSFATVTNCGKIFASSDYSFDDNMEINLGPEAGGNRKVNVTPESTLVDICASMRISTFGKLQRTSFSETAARQLPMNIILGHLHYTSTVLNLYLATNTTIEFCTSVSESILLPNASIRNSTVTSSYLQWKCSISDSTVSNVIMMECSAIGPHSVVASTVLGPDSHVSCGEVHCSLIGPNTNSHHQSLLISTLWPMGRGNVGYGSNIGSNHTGRIPDQECTVGEGIFWGLGCVIKFPVDLSRAFYSVIAAGVNLPPQRVSIPFCLIANAGNSDKNEIVPGWILKSSPYTIVRSEEKFKNRRKAKRHDFYCGWNIMRPGIVDSCVEARSLLRNVRKKLDQAGGNTDEKCTNQVYTEELLPQLGSNYMTERGRKVGIDAYTDFIQRYALKGLLEHVVSFRTSGLVKSQCEMKNSLEALFEKISDNKLTILSTNDKASWPMMPWDEEFYGIKSLWEHQRKIILLEMPSIMKGVESSAFDILKLLLERLKLLEQRHASQVFNSKQRDDIRGIRTIPNYKAAHIMAEDDAIVKLTNSRAEDTVKLIIEIISFCDELELKQQQSSRL